MGLAVDHEYRHRVMPDMLVNRPVATRLGRAGRLAVDPRFAIEQTARLTLDAYRRVLTTMAVTP